MSTQAELKRVRALQQKKYRAEQQRFLVQGPKLVTELLGSGWPVDACYATEEAARRLGLHDAVVLPDQEVERLGTLDSGNEVVAVVPMPVHAPVRSAAPGELLLALDGIADPGNLGTVLRIADWFGVGRVLCSAGSVEVYNPKCVQASMGALFRVEAHIVDLPATLGALRSAGAHLFVASMEGDPVFNVALERPAVLVLGNESHGVSDAVRAMGGRAIAVPRIGRSESLNVAMAASALCMEFTRQWTR